MSAFFSLFIYKSNMSTVRLNKADASSSNIQQIRDLKASLEGSLQAKCGAEINTGIVQLLQQQSDLLTPDHNIGSTRTYSGVISKLHRIVHRWASISIPFLRATLDGTSPTLTDNERVSFQRGTLGTEEKVEILLRNGFIVDCRDEGVLVNFLLIIPSSEAGKRIINSLERYMRIIARQALAEDLPLALRYEFTRVYEATLEETLDTISDTDVQKANALKGVVCYLCTLTFGVKMPGTDRYENILAGRGQPFQELPDTVVNGTFGVMLQANTHIYHPVKTVFAKQESVFSEDIENQLVAPVENLLYLPELFKIIKTLSRVVYNGALPAIHFPS